MRIHYLKRNIRPVILTLKLIIFRCIGRAFERVKKMTPPLRIVDDYFNSDIIRLKSEDRTRFIDFLQTVFEGTSN